MEKLSFLKGVTPATPFTLLPMTASAQPVIARWTAEMGVKGIDAAARVKKHGG